MAAKHRRGFSPLLGVLLQAGIVLLALLPIWLFAIPVATEGLPVGAYLFWGTLAGIATYGVLLLLSLLDLLSPESLKRHIRDLHGFVRAQTWLVLVALAVLAGIGEELMFRGVIQGWLSAHLGSVVGIVAGAVAFGLAHAMSKAYFLVATCLGVIFGIAYEVTDSLQLVMVWHAVYDLVVIIVLRQFPGLFGLSRNAGPE